MTAACRRTSAKGVVDVIGQSPRDPGGVLAALLSEISLDNLDGLRLTDVPFAPGVSLHLASDVVVLEARLQAQWGRVSPPLWADVWAGGQALARHIARYPNLVAGRTVLDVASGSGLVAITAARAGASQVTANDTDPFALAAIALNARTSGVEIAITGGDLLDGEGDGVDVVLAGDVFYCEAITRPMLAFLRRANARGAQVLVGDPGRACLPRDQFSVVARYPLAPPGAWQDAQVRHALVVQPRGTRRPYDGGKPGVQVQV